MTIIGVTDEPSAKIKSFITEKDIKYGIAIGKAVEYKTSGIPHGWLVSPRGEIVWEGHPTSLSAGVIEEHLKSVSLTPTFSLPKDLAAVERQLNTGSLGAGLKALETHLKKPKSPETGAAATGAIEKIKAFGAEQLKRAEHFAKEGDYGDGAEVLQSLEKSFKGTEVADTAKEKLAEWKKDKAIKLELDGAAQIQKADALIQAKQYRNAAVLLAQVAKGKKYDGTRIQAAAQKKLASVEKKL